MSFGIENLFARQLEAHITGKALVAQAFQPVLAQAEASRPHLSEIDFFICA
jgi:hypothetical protein